MINSGTATPRLDLLGPILLEGFQKDQYVAGRVLPVLPVEKKFGAIPSFLFTNDQILQIKRSPKTGFARVQSKLGDKSYRCEEDGVEEPLSAEDYEILGRDRAELLVGNRLAHIVLRARDYALSTAWFSAAGETLFANQVTTAAATWATTGDPFANIAAAKVAVAQRIGVPANKILLSYQAYMNLCGNAKVQSQIRAIAGINDRMALKLELDPNLLAQLFGVDEVIIAGGVMNSANEGQTASRGFIWPATYCLVFRGSAGGARAEEVALGRTFAYQAAREIGDLATGQYDELMSLMLEEYRDEAVAANILRARDYISMNVLVTEAGQLIKSI